MSVGANYAPLNQCEVNTESESEGEPMMEFGNSQTMDVNCGLHSSKQPSMSDYGEYHTTANTIDTTLDNISILQSDSNKMSVRRRIAFTASIFLCVFTFIYFLFGIPCSYSCVVKKPKSWDDEFFSYEVPYDEIELSGDMQVVGGAVHAQKNFIFIYRGNHVKADGEKEIGNINGIMQIVGRTGKVGWYISEAKIPTIIDCETFLINVNDSVCIVSGTEGLLAAVNPIQGGYYWYIGRKTENLLNKVVELDFPLKIPDMDGDSLSDLLLVTTMEPSKHHNTLVMISAKSGELIGIPWAVQCQVVTLENVSNTELCYNCNNNNKESVKTVTLAELQSHMITNITMSFSHNHTENENVTVEKKLETGDTNYIYDNKRAFHLENIGECPGTCRTNLNLSLKMENIKLKWEYTSNHTFALDPQIFSFGYVKGYIIKLWQWNKATHISKDLHDVNEVTFNHQNDSLTDDLIKFKKLNVSSISSYVKYTNFVVHEISEIILVIAFDHRQILHANVSQVELIMVCDLGEDKDINSTRAACQPDLKYQLSSSIIADLDSNRNHEYISYHNSFVPPDENGGKHDSWRLVSYVKVLRMNNELSKLFPEVEE